MKRKKFNLKDFVSNEATPVETRDHQPVRIICTDAKGCDPVVALTPWVKGGTTEEARMYDEKGNWDGKIEYDIYCHDLFFKQQ